MKIGIIVLVATGIVQIMNLNQQKWHFIKTSTGKSIFGGIFNFFEKIEN